MKINGEDIGRYKAKQLTVEFEPPQDGSGYEWPEGMLMPIESQTVQKCGKCTVVLLLRGENRNEITRNSSTLHGLCLPGPVELTLDGYKGTYTGFLKEFKPEKTITPKSYKVQAVFSGWMKDTPVKLEYIGQTQATLHRVGSRPTACVLTIKPQTNIEKLTMKGWGNHDVTVENMTAGHAIVIDGKTGLITQDGENKAQDVTLWALPAMDETQKTITWDNESCDIVVEYTPLWL